MAATSEPLPATAQPAQTQLTGSPGSKGKQAPQAVRAAAKDSGQVQRSSAASQPLVVRLQRPAKAQAPRAAAEEPAEGTTSPAGGVKAEHRKQQSLAAGVQSVAAQLKPASLTAAEGATAEERQQAQQQRPAAATLPAAQQVGRLVSPPISPSYLDVVQAAASSWMLELKMQELQADLSTPAKQQAAAHARQQFQQAHRRYRDTR